MTTAPTAAPLSSAASWTNAVTPSQRAAERIPLGLAARLTWKDSRGTARYASVVARNVSEHGAFVECSTPQPLSLYRLVQLQLESGGKEDGLPLAFQRGRVLTAVYRVTPPHSSGKKQGIALRLLVDPAKTYPARRFDAVERIRATA